MTTNEIKQAPKSVEEVETRPVVAILIIFAAVLSVVVAAFVSIGYGAADIDFSTIWEAIFHFDPALTTHQIIIELRIPRVIGGVLIGSFLAVSGAIMQGMTRNPLADSSIIGISDGAGLAIAILMALFTGVGYVGLMFGSFVGAGLCTALIFLIGSLAKGGLSPAKLALAGITIGAFVGAVSSGIAIYFNVAQDISFWFAGGFTSMNWFQIYLIVPVALVGLIMAFVLARSVTVLSLGIDVARGLGQRTKLIRFFGIITVMLLTGAAVAVSGTIGFIGLVIPHITRPLVGRDYRLIIPCSAALGALLLVLADIAARMVNAPYEVPVGAMTAIIGVPFFLYLARREGRGL